MSKKEKSPIQMIVKTNNDICGALKCIDRDLKSINEDVKDIRKDIAEIKEIMDEREKNKVEDINPSMNGVNENNGGWWFLS